MQNAAFSQIVNRSMSEVLTRSLATSLCTLLPIMALLFFGGSTLKDFAFALLVGVASGAYSSIFIASPVLTHWKEREPVYRRRRARIAAEHGGLVPAYATAGAAAREVDVEASGRRAHRRLTEPPRPEVKAGEFRELVRDLHAEPAKRPVIEAQPESEPPPGARPDGRRAAGGRRDGARAAAALAGRVEVAQPQTGEATLMGMLAWVIMGLASGTSRSGCPTASGAGSSARSWPRSRAGF